VPRAHGKHSPLEKDTVRAFEFRLDKGGDFDRGHRSTDAQPVAPGHITVAKSRLHALTRIGWFNREIQTAGSDR
jgi:hypothetical protein